MNKDCAIALESGGFAEDPPNELIREGARKLLVQVVEAKVQELLAKYEGQYSNRGAQVGGLKRLSVA